MKQIFNKSVQTKEAEVILTPPVKLPVNGENGVYRVTSPIVTKTSPYSSNPVDKLRIAYENLDKR